MVFLTTILDKFLGQLDGAGFFEHVFIILIFGISASVVVGLMYAAVVLLLVALYDWWCGTGGDATAVPAVGELVGPAAGEQVVLPLVADVAVPPAGGQLAARAIRRRRRTARDSAPGEPVSSSGDATEGERE